LHGNGQKEIVSLLDKKTLTFCFISWSVKKDCLSREERNCFISCSGKNDNLSTMTSQLKDKTVSFLVRKRMIASNGQKEFVSLRDQKTMTLCFISWSVKDACLSREERICFISCSGKNDILSKKASQLKNETVSFFVRKRMIGCQWQKEIV
jgi:hypothetical protein